MEVSALFEISKGSSPLPTRKGKIALSRGVFKILSNINDGISLQKHVLS